MTGPTAIRTASTICCVNEIRASIVEVTGAVTGRYELQERSEDGTIVLRPDTSAAAIMRRLASEPVSTEEFDSAFGDLLTGDA